MVNYSLPMASSAALISLGQAAHATPIGLLCPLGQTLRRASASAAQAQRTDHRHIT